MRRSGVLALLFSGGLLLSTAAAVLADSPDAGISVEPSEVTAGQTILIAGNSLEPDDERVLVLQGDELTVSLGTATTDADGMLSQEIQLPAHLPTGTYQLQAIGDETLQVELQVTAAEGAAAEGAAAEDVALGNRDRSGLELGLIVAAAVVLGALGAFLVARAERFGGSSAT